MLRRGVPANPTSGVSTVKRAKLSLGRPTSPCPPLGRETGHSPWLGLVELDGYEVTMASSRLERPNGINPTLHGAVLSIRRRAAQK
jgi:hypothetical protein